MAEDRKATPEDLELIAPSGQYEGRGLKGAREELERRLIQQAIAKNKGNLSRVAAELGVSRPTLYELMEKLGIDKERG
jgi:two-component system NtrC family response regulator